MLDWASVLSPEAAARLSAVCVRAHSRRPNAPEMPSKHDQPHGYTVDSSVQRLGSRRAANAGNRAYAIVHKSVPKARRPASIER